MNTENVHEATTGRQPWRDESGNVDLAVVRRMVLDGPMVGEHNDEYEARAISATEALCDEVEALREQHAEILALYHRNVGSLVDQLDEATAEQPRTCWEVKLVDGLMTGYETWQDAVASARHQPPHAVVRIDGPEGSVPLVGSSLDRELRRANEDDQPHRVTCPAPPTICLIAFRESETRSESVNCYVSAACEDRQRQVLAAEGWGTISTGPAGVDGLGRPCGDRVYGEHVWSEVSR